MADILNLVVFTFVEIITLSKFHSNWSSCSGSVLVHESLPCTPWRDNHQVSSAEQTKLFSLKSSHKEKDKTRVNTALVFPEMEGSAVCLQGSKFAFILVLFCFRISNCSRSDIWRHFLIHCLPAGPFEPWTDPSLRKRRQQQTYHWWLHAFTSCFRWI